MRLCEEQCKHQRGIQCYPFFSSNEGVSLSHTVLLIRRNHQHKKAVWSEVPSCSVFLPLCLVSPPPLCLHSFRDPLRATENTRGSSETCAKWHRGQDISRVDAHRRHQFKRKRLLIVILTSLPTFLYTWAVQHLFCSVSYFSLPDTWLPCIFIFDNRCSFGPCF